jgi:hypothetical protein
MVNPHISISRVFTALTRLDDGVETNWKRVISARLFAECRQSSLPSSAVVGLWGAAVPAIGRSVQTNWSVTLVLHLEPDAAVSYVEETRCMIQRACRECRGSKQLQEQRGDSEAEGSGMHGQPNASSADKESMPLSTALRNLQIVYKDEITLMDEALTVAMMESKPPARPEAGALQCQMADPSTPQALLIR